VSRRVSYTVLSEVKVAIEDQGFYRWSSGFDREIYL
jgi:hypothetical protein